MILYIRARDAEAYIQQGWQCWPMQGWHGTRGRWIATWGDD